MTWRAVLAKHPQNDAQKLAAAGLEEKSEALLPALAENPYANPPPDQKLVDDLAVACSRRINIQHRFGYQVLDTERVVKVQRMWSHYE